MREFLRGAGDLGRGFRIVASTPRLVLLGAIPALVVGAVWLGLLVALLSSVDGVADALTASAAGSPLRPLAEVAVGAAVVVLAAVVGAVSYTAVVLAVGDPCYERISHAVEERLGDAPSARDEPLLIGVLRAAREGLALLVLGALVGVGAFLLGLVPVVGPVLGGLFGAVLGGWLLAVELTGIPFDVRGFHQRERRRMLGRSRARALGFGVVTWVLFLVPLGAVVVMPAAVAGAAVLSRSVLARAAQGGTAVAKG